MIEAFQTKSDFRIHELHAINPIVAAANLQDAYEHRRTEFYLISTIVSNLESMTSMLKISRNLANHPKLDIEVLR